MAQHRLLAFQRHQRRTAHDRNVVARELVAGQQLAHFHLHQIQQLRIIDHVALVHEHHQRRHADLAGQQNVLAGLRHRAVGGRHHQDRAVHLGRAGDHVLHIVGMAGAVDMGVMAGLGLILHMRRRDRDAARLLFRRLVDLVIGRERRPARLRQHLRDRSRQRRLAMIHMADRPDVAVRLVTLEFRFRHDLSLPCLFFFSGLFAMVVFSLIPQFAGIRRSGLERVKGIEPSSSAWKAVALPLSYTRVLVRLPSLLIRSVTQLVAGPSSLLSGFAARCAFWLCQPQPRSGRRLVEGVGFEPT